jgi:oligopeptide transport system permease protein
MATASATPADRFEPQAPARAQVSLWSDAWRRLRRNRLAWVSAFYLALVIAVAILSVFWTPYSTSHLGVLTPYTGPTPSHPLGGDQYGRDILSRLMEGARTSMTVGIGTQIAVLAVGVTVGLLAGYLRGWFDTVVTFVINVFYGIPDLLVALILVFLIGSGSLGTIIFAIAVTRWMDMARLVRGQTLSLREREFVEAAKAAGAKPRKIIFGHIFPNALGPIIVQATIGVPSAILFEAFMSFLGLGVQPPTASWGSMSADGVAAIRVAPHIVLAPSIALMITLMAFNFLGDGLRDALDPRQRR